MRTKQSFLMAMNVVCLGVVGVSVGWLLRRQLLMEKQLTSAQAHPTALHVQESVPQVVEKIVTSAQLWRPVQEQVKDTVVQIFSQVAEMDLLQPYKTPKQGVVYGSGFFINDQGEIITNAHVVNEAVSFWIQIPSLGKRILDVELLGVSPDRDLALLRVMPESLEVIKRELGGVPFLALGDSDVLRRSDEVLALGYPLGQQSLKSTSGVISGRERHMIQHSSPINPGSSGGPLLNAKGEVMGINNAGVVQAQNVGYAIPVNDLKIILNDLRTTKLLHQPRLGVVFSNGTDALTQYLKNPLPGGCYVAEVVRGSTLEKAGVKTGDMIYEVNGCRVDQYGEMSMPWSEDKVSIVDFVGRLSLGQTVDVVIYRQGERKEYSVQFCNIENPSTIKKIYPGFETVDYEVFGGMVVMELTLDHIHLLAKQAPGLTRFAELSYNEGPVLVVTHIFPTAQLYRSRSFSPGTTLLEVNGVKVKTLKDYRAAIRRAFLEPFLTLRVSDNIARASDNIFVALNWDKVLGEEVKLAQDFRYPMSPVAHELLAQVQAASNQQKTVVA